MKTKWIILAVVAVGAWLYFRSRAAEAPAAAPSQPPPQPTPDTPLERAQAMLPPGTTKDFTGAPYEPPLKA